MDELKRIFYYDEIINKYTEKLEEEVTDEEMTEYIKSTYGEDSNFNEYVTRHILFLTTDTSTNASLSDEEKEEKRVKAEEVLARALSGENFEDLAKEFSEDSTASDGGLYKMYLNNTTDEAYESAVLGLEVGGITTSLVESSFGYHIIKLDAINENGRVNSEYERSSYVNDKISTLTTEKNLAINDDLVSSLSEEIMISMGVGATSTEQ